MIATMSLVPVSPSIPMEPSMRRTLFEKAAVEAGAPSAFAASLSFPMMFLIPARACAILRFSMILFITCLISITLFGFVI